MSSEQRSVSSKVWAFITIFLVVAIVCAVIIFRYYILTERATVTVTIVKVELVKSDILVKRIQTSQERDIGIAFIVYTNKGDTLLSPFFEALNYAYQNRVAIRGKIEFHKKTKCVFVINTLEP